MNYTASHPNSPCQSFNPQDYFATFITPAHPTRLFQEFVTHPRTVNYRERPKESVIKRGWTVIKKCRCSQHPNDDYLPCKKCKNVIRLERLDDHNYRMIRAHIQRKDGGKLLKRSLLTTYDDDSFVSFIQFDVDRHYVDCITPDDCARVDADCRRKVINFKQVMRDVGFDCVWTTSPGHLHPITGKITHGLYAWIKLDGIEFVDELRKWMKDFKEYHDISDIEDSWDTEHRLIRLPGFRWVEVADSETAEILFAAPDDAPQMTFINFASRWDNLKSISADKLFHAPREWRRESDEPQSETRVDRVDGVTRQETRPFSEIHHHTFERLTIDYPKERLASWTIEAQSNTWIPKCESGLAGSLVRAQYHSLPKHERTAPKEIVRGYLRLHSLELRATFTTIYRDIIRPGSDCPIDDHQRWIDWMIDNFDPSKLKGTWEQTAMQDKWRFAYMKNVNVKKLLRILKAQYDLTYKELGKVETFIGWMLKYTGRVGSKKIHRDPSIALFTTDEWRLLRDKLGDALVVLDKHDHSAKKCTQWGIKKPLIWLAGQEVIEELKPIIEEEKSKKRIRGIDPTTGQPLSPTERQVESVLTQIEGFLSIPQETLRNDQN